MFNLKVDSGGKVYPLFIGTDILSNLSEIYKLYGYKPGAVVITDFDSQQGSYLDIFFENFKKVNIEIIPIFLANQHARNGLRTIVQIANRLVKSQFQSDETIISLGGSSVSNISAFIAHILYGGVPYVQIPTTLTAQVVQSVDPIAHLNSAQKLDLFSIKYEHSLVWCDVALLKSLPEKNFISGLAYIIQYACLHDDGLFEFLEKNLKQILSLNPKIIEETVFRSCQTRINLLKQCLTKPKNPKQPGFGEFIASILVESAQHEIKFGEALLFGMLVEGIVAFRSGIFSGAYFERFYELLNQIPFYHFANQIDPNNLIESLKKRMSSHKLTPLNLPQQFGKFSTHNEYKLSDFATAFALVLTT